MTALVTDNLPLMAGAASGIKLIRGLIIDLAVTGRLMPQNFEEEPPSEALARVSAERDRLIASGKLRRPLTTVVASGRAFVFRLPSNWTKTSLAEAVALVTDGDHQPPPTAESGVPFLVIGNLSGGSLDLRNCRYVERSYFDSLDWGRRPTKGDLLYTVTGSFGIPVEVATEAEFCVQRHVAIIKNTSEMPTSYLRLVLSSAEARRYAVAVATGTAQKTVPLTALRRLPVPLPPIQEQHRIVAKVDELMALCDRLDDEQSDAEAAHAKLVEALLASLTQARDAADFRASWQQLAEHFHTLFITEASVDALKQSVMQLGVEGRLCTGAARSTWRLRTINEFCTVQGGIQKTPLRAPVKHHFPYLRVANVQRGRIDIARLERYELASEELQRWRLNAGDLLIVEGNGSESEVGRCAIWHGEVEDCVYQNHLMRVRPTGDDAVDYLALYLNSPIGTAHMRRLAITTSGLFNLSVGKIRSIPVELPPPSEQHRIVAKVRELLALCDQLKVGISQARQIHENLASVLVEQAVA